MGLENFCVEPYFSNLRHNMRELVEVLAAVAAGVPQQHYGFYRLETKSFICEWESSCARHPRLFFVVDCVAPVTQGTATDPRAIASQVLAAPPS